MKVVVIFIQSYNSRSLISKNKTQLRWSYYQQSLILNVVFSKQSYWLYDLISSFCVGLYQSCIIINTDLLLHFWTLNIWYACMIFRWKHNNVKGFLDSHT